MGSFKPITTKNFRIYFSVFRVVAYSIPLALILLLFVNGLESLKENLSNPINYAFYLPLSVAYIYGLFTGLDLYKKIQQVEHDDENLYVEKESKRVVVPFENVHKIRIDHSAFVFELYKTSEVGKEIWCLPSIWYPFDYKSIDHKMSQIRGLVQKRKDQFFEKQFLEQD